MKKTSSDERTYTCDGKVYPSVTTVLAMIAKPALIGWAAKQGSYANYMKAKTGAAGIGTRAHKIIEDYFEAEVPAVIFEPYEKDEVKRCIDGFLKWMDKVKFQMIHSEIKCYSHKYKCAGTADMVAIIDGYLTVPDWKTSSGIYDEHLFQTEAYATFLDEMNETGLINLPGKIERKGVVRLGKKDASFNPHIFKRDKKHFNGFKHAYGMYQDKKYMKTFWEKYDNENRRKNGKPKKRTRSTTTK